MNEYLDNKLSQWNMPWQMSSRLGPVYCTCNKIRKLSVHILTNLLTSHLLSHKLKYGTTSRVVTICFVSVYWIHKSCPAHKWVHKHIWCNWANGYGVNVHCGSTLLTSPPINDMDTTYNWLPRQWLWKQVFSSIVTVSVNQASERNAKQRPHTASISCGIPELMTGKMCEMIIHSSSTLP